MPVFVFMLLKDWDRLRAASTKRYRHGAGHTRVSFRFFRMPWFATSASQLLLGLAVANLSLILLTILRIQFALPLARLAGAMDLVPSIGPVLGGAVPVLVTLATALKSRLGGSRVRVIQLLEESAAWTRVPGRTDGDPSRVLARAQCTRAYFAGVWGHYCPSALDHGLS